MGDESAAAAAAAATFFLTRYEKERAELQWLHVESRFVAMQPEKQGQEPS